MNKVELKHNPYTCQNEIIINGKKDTDGRMYKHIGNQRICKWISTFFKELDEAFHEDEVFITFTGREQDYQDLLEEAKIYNKEKNTKIEVVFNKSLIEKNDNDRLEELKKLCQEAKDGPVEDLKGDAAYKKFEDITNPKFSATVVATMSSGKSTLINALLGHELLPAKNEATTATITEIIDINEDDKRYNGKKYSMRVIDKDGHNLMEKLDANKTDLEEWNSKKEVAKIIIQGPIPGINIKELEFSIFDTPGPNNSSDMAHADKTNQSLKNDAHSMVFYVLNGTQLEIKDDRGLLTEVSKQMKEEGKQSHDRFIFVMNKMDDFDPQKGETVKSAVEKAVRYLGEFKIEKPIIIPISARLAKMIRCQRDDQGSLSKKEKSNLLSDINLHSEDEYDFNESVTNVGRAIRNKIGDLIKDAKEKDDKDAKEKGDKEELALLHSGLPMLELIIDDYINKYAIPCRIKDAKDALDEGIALTKKLENFKERLGADDNERKRVNERLLEAEKRMQRGEEAKKFREQIKNLSVKNTKASEKIREETGKIRTDFRKMIDNGPKEVDTDEMPQIIRNMKDKVEQSVQRIKSSFNDLLPEIRKNQFENIRNEYLDYVKDLLGGDDKSISVILEASIYRFDGSFDFNVREHDYKTVSRRRKVGTTSADVDWVDWCTLGISRLFKDDVPIYEEEEKVKVRDTLSKPQQNLETWLVKTEKLFDEQVEKELSRMKNECLQNLESIEAMLKETLDKIKGDTESKEALEKAIEAGKEQIAWIKDFQERLNKVISID